MRNMHLVLLCTSLVIGHAAAAPSTPCGDSCSGTTGNDDVNNLLQMRNGGEVGYLKLAEKKMAHGIRNHEYRNRSMTHLHRFCDGGKEVDLCGFPHYEFDAWKYDDKAKLETYHMDSEPKLVHGHACLELWDVHAETEQECRNYEKAFAILHDQANVSSYEVPGGLPGVPSSFHMMGAVSAGTHFVLVEFVHNFYRIDKMGLTSGDVLFDVGGNIACFSVVAAKTFPDLKVVTFEANPINFLLAHHNVAANDLKDRVSVIGRAINGDGSDLPVLYMFDNPGSSYGRYGSKLTQNHDLAGDSFIVPATTMEAAVTKYSPEHGSIAVKMDCEGCEHFAVDYLSSIEGRIKSLRGEIHQIDDASRSQMETTLSFFKRLDPSFECTWCSGFFGNASVL